MPLTSLDEKAALVVIDLQNALAAAPVIHPIPEIVARAARLASGFREHHLPVVLVNVDGRAPGRTEAGSSSAARPVPADGGTDFIPELGAQPGDKRITKRTWGAFHNTELDEYLRGQGVTQVVVVGVATSAGVESTARAAYEHGYNVVLATDAMTDLNADAHTNSVTRIFPRLGETATTDEILKELDASH